MSDSLQNLILITSHFPYGLKESFIEIEWPFLRRRFSKIIIITSNVSEQHKREVGEDVNIYRYSTRTGLVSKLALPFFLAKRIPLITKNYSNEIRFRKSIGQHLSIRQKQYVLKRIIKALQFANFIQHVIGKEILEGDTLIYSYWLFTGAHALGMLPPAGLVKIARAHRSDLYEEITMYKIHPLHSGLSSKLDGLFFISKNGMEYFQNRFSPVSSNLYLSKLGVNRVNLKKRKEDDFSQFLIVSCSHVIPVKRVDRIIDALKHLTPDAQKIHWVHFGDGALMEFILNKAHTDLDPLHGLTYDLKGWRSNDEIHKYYATENVHLLVNVSESEGLPVSIMEAQAYGIPCLATNVGGTAELVTNETGILLDKDFNTDELVKGITHFLSLKPEEWKTISDNCVLNWRNNHNADTNYTNFIQDISKITETRSHDF